MADDPSQSVADPNVTEPNIIPPAESASVPTDRPVSTILADSPTEPKTPLADPGSDYTVATESASIALSPSTVPAESPDQSANVPTEAQGEASPPTPPPVPDEIAVTPPQSEPQVAPTPPPEATSEGSIQDSFPSDQPSRVQSEAPERVSGPQASQEPETVPQSAEIKPEPPQGIQEAPLADPGTPISPKTSFGDLVSDQPSPVSPPVSPLPSAPSQTGTSGQPPQSLQAPKTSFGDFVGTPPTEEPTITIEPVEPPKPVQPPQPPQSPLTGAPVQAGTSGQPSTETVIEAKADFSYKRQQALQTRRKKRQDHFAKILTLVSQKGKIHNSDIVTLLRVSQSTATNYLHSLVKDGKIKKEGKAKATTYSL
ncbi:hypothetical protein HY950_00130 [Candidatus Gottesmanbacteria bacterium]|nr:hypothetical protein [Candidatus Gottesmanbacteria bacterium]